MRQSLSGLAVLSAVVCLCQCKPGNEGATTTGDEEVDRYFTTDPVSRPESAENRLANEPTDFLRSRAGDAIHWQPWTPELLEVATDEQRPVFAVLASGQIPACHDFLDHFATPGSAFVERFNKSYLCTLVDVEANPEMAQLGYLLCGETRQAFTFPILLWLSHEGNPVAWLALRQREIAVLENGIETSHTVVQEVWQDLPRYFVENSRRDAEGRRKRAEIRAGEEQPDREEARELLRTSLRSLTSLFDPASRNIDLGGGLVPSDLLRLSGQAGHSALLTDTLRDRARRMTVEMHDVLSHSPMRDPLDRGFFASRRSTDWSVPVFNKNARTQSSAAVSFAGAGRHAGSDRFAEVSLQLLAFAERMFGDSGEGVGTYRTLADPDRGLDLFFWTYEELEELLTPEQLAVAKVAFGVEVRGNIPPGQDASARYYRRNILAEVKDPEKVAAELGLSADEARDLIAVVRETLRSRRAVKAGEDSALFVETTRLTQHNATHACALLRVGAIVQRPELVDQGRSLLKHLKNNFYSPKDGLWRIPPDGERRGIRARGVDYAVLLAAVLESYSLSLDGDDLAWAEALAGEALRALATEEGVLNEAPRGDLVVDFPAYNATMLLGNSTWGTIFGSLETLRRLSSRPEFGEAADAIALRLVPGCRSMPLVHTDLLEGLFVRASSRVAVLHGDDAGLRAALHEVLLDPAFEGTVIVRAEDLAGNERLSLAVPGGNGVSLFRNLQRTGSFEDPDNLREFLRQDSSSP